ncbi:MAG: helix-turn-helix domain-containing protein [Sphaerochaetaceae bacterium]|jgi:transcriptional regulator with XRE-family HTH domain|nr:helix-turn-helix domain-containing protein [Sphaerochaetaceae bacterium]
MITIAQNIKSFRKQRLMTQEQLAETLGVTVGAVSKWEAGLTTPDLSLIVTMASFFETSVDVLLGYELHKQSVEVIIKSISELRNRKRFDEAAAMAEQALMKYPNCFELVYRCASLYALKGMEESSKRDQRRALELYNRSLELIDQNKNDKINVWTIKNHIANCYMGLEEKDKALEQLKMNNADGLNDASIGFILATDFKKPDEALKYLSSALISETTSLLRVASGYASAFAQKKDYKKAKEVLLWYLDFYSALKPDEPSYIDKEEAQLYTSLVSIEMEEGEIDSARLHLSKALEEASIFDASPVYSLSNLKFVEGVEMTAFDNFGISAKQGILDSFKKEEDKELRAKLISLWEQTVKA